MEKKIHLFTLWSKEIALLFQFVTLSFLTQMLLLEVIAILFIRIRAMAYISMVTALSISSYCQSDVETQSSDIYTNIFFSMPYRIFDIIDVCCLLTLVVI